ncbi:MAG: shikimate dehydrogenase [Halobacteriota archaeon]
MALTQVYGIIGSPIGHTLSPIMHNTAFKELGLNCVYHAFNVEKQNAERAIKGALALGFGGLNVTIPLKELALQYVNPDTWSRRIGAINTIDSKGNGYNTDGVGTVRALKEAGVRVRDSSVLMIGAGGAAKSIAAQLLTEGARVLVANRTKSRAVILAEKMVTENISCGCDDIEPLSLDEVNSVIGEVQVLINTTSVGMHGIAEGQTIVRAEQMHKGLVVFDIVYNPLETELLKEARKAGCMTIEGVKMLVYQGAASFKIWTGFDAPIKLMESAARASLRG